MGTLHSLSFPALNLIKLPAPIFLLVFVPVRVPMWHTLTEWLSFIQEPFTKVWARYGEPVKTSAVAGPWNSWAKGRSGYRNMERAPQLGLGRSGGDTAYLWCSCRERAGAINTASSFCSLVSSGLDPSRRLTRQSRCEILASQPPGAPSKMRKWVEKSSGCVWGNRKLPYYGVDFFHLLSLSS